MATRIKVTLDTDQWARVYYLLGDRIKKDDWLGRRAGKEVHDAFMLAARGTGEGEPCQCEEVDGE